MAAPGTAMSTGGKAGVPRRESRDTGIAQPKVIADGGSGHRVRRAPFRGIKTLFATTVTPSMLLNGVTWPQWWSFLSDHQFKIPPRYWPRALATCCGALANSVLHASERRRFDAELADVEIKPPIFVLGFNRSGTTHLHNLLCLDERFGFANTYQTMFPSTFLTTEHWGIELFNVMMLQTRPMDNMACAASMPQEDELALCTLTGLSPYTAWIFPQRRDQHEHYQTFDGASDADLRRWREAMTTYLKKLSYRRRRPLVLKSPPHTARIALLLDMFPKAKFVHIHRNPYDVFQSASHTFRTVSPYMRVQALDEAELENRLVRYYRNTYESFFAQKDQVPPGQFHEVAFADLEADPVGEMRKIYAQLALPEFDQVEPVLRDYVGSLRGYRKNRYGPIEESTRRRIATEWGFCFDHWGYSV